MIQFNVEILRGCNIASGLILKQTKLELEAMQCPLTYFQN